MGKESPNFSSIMMQRFQSPLMDLPTSIYMLYEDSRVEDKVVTAEGVSCITTQTTRISKYVFFDIFRRHTRVAETTVMYMRRYTWVAMQKVMYLWHT